MEVIELNPDILEVTSSESPKISELDKRPSSNFGAGIELLMNDKKTEKKESTSINIDDISKLEDELNDLTGNVATPSFSDKKLLTEVKEMKETNEIKEIKEINEDTKQIPNKPEKKNMFSNLFGKNNNAKNLGETTANLSESKTSDGFGKFNNIPISLDKKDEKRELSKEEELREKFTYLRKLEDLEKKGVSLSKRYNMDSKLEEMIGEYETIIAEKERTNSIKFQGKMLMACITGIEFLNNKFDPFDIKLDGLGEQINENIEEYDEIFGELHEKYKSKAKMSPELKLLFQLGGSAMMVHMSNTLFKSTMPGMDDIMRQNPDLMKQFTQAAVNTMGQSNPGFGGFMNNLFDNKSNQQTREQGLGSGANPGFGAMQQNNRAKPPSPIDTKLPDRSKRVQNLPSRPDLMSARGVIDDNLNNIQKEEQRITRPEMKGPSSMNAKQSEINSLLSGLKPKQVNITEQNESSTISVDDLKDLTGGKVPKSKRKQKSDKNVVSLDI